MGIKGPRLTEEDDDDGADEGDGDPGGDDDGHGGDDRHDQG